MPEYILKDNISYKTFRRLFFHESHSPHWAERLELYLAQVACVMANSQSTTKYPFEDFLMFREKSENEMTLEATEALLAEVFK